MNTFVTIDLFTCWLGIFFGQKRPDDVGKAVLCTMEEGFEVSLPSYGGFSSGILEGGRGDCGCGCCCLRCCRCRRCSCHEEREAGQGTCSCDGKQGQRSSH